MIKTISTFVANRKAAREERRKRRKEPKGGQFISFEQEDLVGVKDFSWTKCQASFEELWETCGAIHSSNGSSGYGGSKTVGKSNADMSVTEATTPASSGFMSLSSSSDNDSQSQGGLAITRRPLPDDSGTFSLSGKQSAKISGWSRHAMVNNVRGNLPPLTRCHELDDLAREQAKAMANEGRVFHSDPKALVGKLKSIPKHRLGENVFKGKTMSKLDAAMTDMASDYFNLTDKRYNKMGLATARDEKGTVYQCILFSG